MPQPTATPEPPEPDARLDVPVTVWLAPHLGRRTDPEQPAPDDAVFALPSWALARLADVYAPTPRSGTPARLWLWRPSAADPISLPCRTAAAAGIVVDLTACRPLGEARALAVLGTATEQMPLDAYLFAVTAHDPDTAEEVCGPVIRAAQALQLAYVQHLIVVNGHADGDRIIPHPGDFPPPAHPTDHSTAHTGRPAHDPVHLPLHTDLLVFRASTPDTPTGTPR